MRSPRYVLASIFLAALGGVAAACSGAPPQPLTPEPVPHADVKAAPVEEPDAGAEVAQVDAGDTGDAGDAGVPAEAAVPDKAGACPADMVLVEGEYCTEIDIKCLKSHYAKQNAKTICEHFEPASNKCVGKKEHRRFCVDKYEYPNKKGEKPEVNNNFPQAQHLCAAVGKRMCTETEWTMACEGPEYKPYPYGFDRDPKKCNGDRHYITPDVQKTFSKNKAEAKRELDRLWQGVPSGSQPDCVSDYGVADMPGNADELASSETGAPRSKFDNVTTGGPWVDGVRNQCRPKIYTHNEGFAYYYLSFRCCAETDGKPTDPRSPKQIARGEKWK